MSFGNPSLAVRIARMDLLSAYTAIDFVGSSLNSKDQKVKEDAERTLYSLQREDIVRPSSALTDILVRVQKLTGESVDPRQYVDRLKQAYESGEDMKNILSDAKKAFDHIKTFFG